MDLQRAKEQVDYALSIGKPGAAIEIIKAVISEEPEAPYFLTSLARAYMDANQTNKAKEAIKHSLSVDPEFFWTHGIYGLILEKEGNHYKAEEEYKIGLQLYPESNMILNNYARFLYEHRGDYQSAEEYARKLLSLNPDDENHYILLGKILRGKGDNETAKGMFKEALRINPEDYEAHYYLGVVELYQDNNPKKAFEHLRSAIRLNPQSEVIRDEFFQALKGKNKFYWLFWNWSLLLGKLGKYRWAFVVGIWLSIKILSAMSRNNPQLTPIILPIVTVYACFVIYTWIAEPLFNQFIKRGWIR